MKNLILLVILAFAGCATVADIRSQPPDQTIESASPPKQIANCVLHKAPEKAGTYGYTISENPPGTFNIFIASPMPVGEATFRSNGNGGTQIELRSRWNFWGKDAFWECIQRCASPQNNPGAVEGVK